MQLRLLCLMAVAAALLVAAVPAQAAKAPLRCGNVRLDQELKLDPHGLFGAFRIRATRVKCETARTVARDYTQDLHALDKPSVREGKWRCSWRAAKVAQQVNASCRRGTALVTFVYKIPNG